MSEALSEKAAAWLRGLSRPLRTLDPEDPDDTDLEPLREIVGDARLVAIGESTHQCREFYQLRHRLTRFLIREMGFTGVAIESGFAEGLQVDAWVQGGDGDLQDVATSGITYGFGQPDEVQRQVQWLRDWNAAQDRKVSFYGIDVSGAGSTFRPAVEAALRRLPPQPGDAELLRLSDLGVRRVVQAARYQALSEAERNALTVGVAELADRAARADDELAYRCARSAMAHEAFIRGGRRLSSDWNPRDELMAENVLWALGRHEKVVVAAHNAHIQRGHYLGGPMMGRFLEPVLGASMVVIGTTMASGRVGRKTPAKAGPAPAAATPDASPPSHLDFAYEELAPPPPQTIDALMDAVGPPLHLVDLRGAAPEHLAGVTAMLAMHEVVPVDPKAAFDVLVHVRRVTPVAGDLRPLYL